MGGLQRYMPVTYWTSLVGSLALIGFPGFAGFFSKDALIEAVELSTLPGSTYAFACLLTGVFVTALSKYVSLEIPEIDRFVIHEVYDAGHRCTT